MQIPLQCMNHRDIQTYYVVQSKLVCVHHNCADLQSQTYALISLPSQQGICWLSFFLVWCT